MVRYRNRQGQGKEGKHSVSANCGFFLWSCFLMLCYVESAKHAIVYVASPQRSTKIARKGDKGNA
jgi:hypothetical protein